MNKQIKRLSAHFVVCGFGRIGKTVCAELHEHNIPLVVVESDPVGFQQAIECGYLSIQGNSTDDDVLHEAGVSLAAGVVCVVNSDAENVFIALSAREMNNDALIASRADAEGAARKIARAGASLVVSPYTTAGTNIASAILQRHVPHLLRDQEYRKSNLELRELAIDSDSPLIGQVIGVTCAIHPSIVIVAIRRLSSEVIMRPDEDTQILQGDVCTVAGHPEDLDQFLRESQAKFGSNEGNHKIKSHYATVVQSLRQLGISRQEFSNGMAFHKHVENGSPIQTQLGQPNVMPLK